MTLGYMPWVLLPWKTRHPLVMWLVYISSIAACYFGYLLMSYVSNVNGPMSYHVAALIMLLAPILVWLTTFLLICAKIGRDRLVSDLRDRRRCAACFYPLDDCKPEPDGCTVCPECGAAWRLPESTAGDTGSGG